MMYHKSNIVQATKMTTFNVPLHVSDRKHDYDFIKIPEADVAKLALSCACSEIPVFIALQLHAATSEVFNCDERLYVCLSKA